VWLFLSLGVHDRIQNMMKKNDAHQTTKSTPEKQTKKPHIPKTPLSKRLPLEASDAQLEQPESITSDDPEALKEK
jgi:hypothetical protein